MLFMCVSVPAGLGVSADPRHRAPWGPKDRGHLAPCTCVQRAHAGVQHHSVSDPVYPSCCKCLVPGHKEPVFDVCSSPQSGSSGLWPGEVSIPPSTSAHSILPMGCSGQEKLLLTVTGAEGRFQPVTQGFVQLMGPETKTPKK